MRSSRAPHRHILVPLDGSAASQRGLREALRLARPLRARVTALHVITPFEAYTYSESLPAVMTRADFEKRTDKASARILERARRACNAARVRCRCLLTWDTRAAEAIVRAARKHRCDLVVMSSHGRRGLQRVLMGSVSRGVLAQSPVPVVICR